MGRSGLTICYTAVILIVDPFGLFKYGVQLVVSLWPVQIVMAQSDNHEASRQLYCNLHIKRNRNQKPLSS
jgi:hypothetical protein